MTILTTPVWPIIPFTPSTGDPQGNLWVGTLMAGQSINKSANKFTHYKQQLLPESLGNNNVLDILEDGRDNLWIGTDGGGLDRVDGRTAGSLISRIALRTRAVSAQLCTGPM